MSNITSFTGPFAAELDRFLSEKRTLGCKYREGERTLHRFDELSSGFDCSSGLSKELALAFTEAKPHWRKTTQEQRISVINQFAKYLTRHGIPAYVQSGGNFTHSTEYFAPHIFSNAELTTIFKNIDHLKPWRKSSHHIVYPVLYRVLFGCGLRISEALALNVCDVDLKNATLRIWNSKNHKDRLVPMSDSLDRRVSLYLEQFHFLSNDTDPLFPSSPGKRYTQTTIYHLFRNIMWECGISHGGRGKGPRLHDLRHTFAVHSLMQFEKDGVDMNAAFPLLSAYLGHTTLSETGKYLRLTAECFPEIREKLEKRYCEIFPEEVTLDETY